MNNQFEALNAPKIDLPFFFFHSCELNTTYLSLSLNNELKKPKILILKFLWFCVLGEANDSGWATFVCDSVCLEKPYVC